MPPITSIVPKLLILVDAYLEQYVTVTTSAAPASMTNCGMNTISGGLTPCGQEYVVDSLEELLRWLIDIGMTLLPVFWPAVYSS